MSDPQTRRDDSRWSDLDVLEEPSSESDGWSLDRFWRKLKLLRYQPWVVENAATMKGLALLVALVLIVSVVIGILLRLTEKPLVHPPATSPGQHAVSASPTSSMPVVQPSGSQEAQSLGSFAGEDSTAGESDSTLDAAGATEAGPLSDDVTCWKKNDFFRARAENDPRLFQAIEYLGIQFAGNEPVARGLAALLESFDAEAALARNPHLQIRPRTFADNSRLVEAIVTALGNNGSDFARNVLTQILAGSLSTDDNRIAVETAMKMLVARPCKENDDLLSQVLVSPGTLRPPHREGVWKVAEMQARAAELARLSDSDSLRTAVAERFDARFSQLPPTHPVYALLSETNPVNCRAQMLLYGKAGMARDVKARLEKQLLDYASTSLACLLGIPNDGFGGRVAWPAAAGESGAEPQTVDVDRGSRLAMHLWSDEFAAVLGGRLADLWSWERQSNLVLLASAIPTDSVRANLLRQLRKHWADGPKALEAAGFPDGVMSDPGLLVLMKTLPRRAKPVGKPTRPAPSNKVQQAAQQKEQAEQDWMTMSSKMVAAWQKRLHAAALAQANANLGAGASRKSADAALPPDFDLSPNARVTAAYHRSWPQESPFALGPNGISPLEVYYLSLEENGKPRKVISYYSRQAQAKFSDARPGERSVAIDNLRFVQGDRRRSVDIVVARPADDANNTDMLRDESDAELVVKILIVEIKDPG